MSVSDILNVATLVSVLIGIAAIFVKGAKLVRDKDIKNALDNHQLEEAFGTISDCKTDIKSIGGVVDGMNKVVHDINKYGSEGATKEFTAIKKTLDNHGKRLIRIEAHVNGGLDKVPPDEL